MSSFTKKYKAPSIVLAIALYTCNVLQAQLRIEDVSPRIGATTLTQGPDYQSVSGKGLTIAMAAGGQRVYLGGHSGVWRSDDGGVTWMQPVRPQPPAGSFAVTGALLCPNVYDLMVSPSGRDIVFAATGRDARIPSKAGIYRSANGGNTWTLVHQFGTQTARGIVSRMVVAPDNASLMFAAGQTALGISDNAGVTWREVRPQGTFNFSVWSVAVGRQQAAGRRVYASGSRIWYSLNGGDTWVEDPVANQLSITTGAPSDGLGSSAKALAIHPSNANIIYVNSNGKLWRGDFSAVANGGSATWRELPATPIIPNSPTASGTDYIVTHMSPEGQLYLFASDRRTTHISIGEPDAQSDWIMIDHPKVHVDPHGLDITNNFRFSSNGAGASGRIVVVNDGGAYFSTNGSFSWGHGAGLTTLGLVNATVIPKPGAPSAICIGTGDNSGFYTRDDGATWKTQEYLGGDNDACFSDAFQSNRLLVFAPRSGDRGIFLYTAPEGQTPDGAMGTSQRRSIPAPPRPPDDSRPWNVVSSHFNMGYRPVIASLAGQQPRPDGDFVAIRYTSTKAVLVRTTALSTINNSNDWVTTATAENAGAKVFQEGPDLPVMTANVVQVSGGHEAPVFYVGDLENSQRVWKWREGMGSWQQIVPASGTNVPNTAIRFFVDPYRPDIIYVLNRNGVFRSDNGGSSWTNDTKLQNAMTENGAFPLVIPNDGNPGEALIRDIIFDPYRPGVRFAVGPAGVFYTTDANNWFHFILTSAMPMRPNNATYNPCERALYVATNNRGLLRLSPLPPHWEGAIGGVFGAQGKISMLRVHDVGTGFGPASDHMDVEVVVRLDTHGSESFGFQLRRNNDEDARKGMLDLLRQAFNTNRTVRIDYIKKGCNTGQLIRVWFP